MQWMPACLERPMAHVFFVDCRSAKRMTRVAYALLFVIPLAERESMGDYEPVPGERCGSNEAEPQTDEACVEANGALAKPQAVLLLAASNLQSTKPRYKNLAQLQRSTPLKPSREGD